MADEFFYEPNGPPAPPRQAQPGQRLFEFVRAADRALMSCELRFHGESYGWERNSSSRFLNWAISFFFSGMGHFLIFWLFERFPRRDRLRD